MYAIFSVMVLELLDEIKTWIVTSKILAKGPLLVVWYKLSMSNWKSLYWSTVIRFRSNFSSGKNRSRKTRKAQRNVKTATFAIRTHDLSVSESNLKTQFFLNRIAKPTFKWIIKSKGRWSLSVKEFSELVHSIDAHSEDGWGGMEQVPPRKILFAKIQ